MYISPGQKIASPKRGFGSGTDARCPGCNHLECVFGGANPTRRLDPDIRANGFAHQGDVFGSGTTAGETGRGFDEISTGLSGQFAGKDFLFVGEQGCFDDDLEGGITAGFFYRGNIGANDFEYDEGATVDPAVGVPYDQLDGKQFPDLLARAKAWGSSSSTSGWSRSSRGLKTICSDTPASVPGCQRGERGRNCCEPPGT
mgnify:CR=1 FL=1